MKNKRIGILGFSADPIHLGHIQIAEGVLNYNVVDEVWLMPCAQRAGKILSNKKYRLDMCYVAITNTKSNIEVSSIDMDKNPSGKALELFYILDKEFSTDFTFYYIIGMDNALSIKNWYNYDELIKTVPFIVVPRKGYYAGHNNMWFRKPPHIFLENLQISKTHSSTQIKKWIFESTIENFISVYESLNKNVLNYIIKNNLYRESVDVEKHRIKTKIINSDVICSTKYLNMIRTTFVNRSNEEHRWYWCERTNNRKAVVIVATMNDKLVVTKEFRVPINDYEWGFPAGLIDDNEIIEEAAKRELKEETGLDIKDIYKIRKGYPFRISPFIYNSPGITDESVVMVYCTVDGEINYDKNEASEDIKVFLLSQTEVYNLLLDESIKFGAKTWIEMNNFANFGCYR